MKKLISKIDDKARELCARVHMRVCSAESYLAEKKGDISTNAIGGIILGVVFIGLAVVAINKFFPGFFDGMFKNMQTKLNTKW